MTTKKRDWIRTAGITGATLLVAGALVTGGMFAANATGVITLPQHNRGGMMGGQFDGQGRGGMMDRDGRGDRGGRGGRGDHDDRGGMMGLGGEQRWGGQMMPNGGMSMLDGNGVQRFDGTQISPEEQTLLHTVVMLQQEQALATALADTSPAAKAIAAARTSELTTLTAWIKAWYPTATVPTAPSASGTLDDLRQLVAHHTLLLDKVTTNATFTHTELQKWLTDALKRRATESTTLFDGQSS